MFGLIIFMLILWAIYETITLFYYGLPVSDADILASIEKAGQSNTSIVGYDDDQLEFGEYRGFKMPRIKRLKSLLFPYSISEVGVVPVWYKSAKIIEQAFKKHRPNTLANKRRKLGL
jgi:hypothetical protein